VSKIPDAKLRRLRNELAINQVITASGVIAKEVEGYFRFLCPICSEFHTATNPRTNLARCFRCKRNFNAIDFVMLVKKISFLEAVKSLDRMLKES